LVDDGCQVVDGGALVDDFSTLEHLAAQMSYERRKAGLLVELAILQLGGEHAQVTRDGEHRLPPVRVQVGLGEYSGHVR
jgi:hypothetical protein